MSKQGMFLFSHILKMYSMKIILDNFLNQSMNFLTKNGYNLRVATDYIIIANNNNLGMKQDFQRLEFFYLCP